ncbi:unknown [Mycoplasma sp. CAG:956]|nr:unknown [Mycoplasma sp. CAG:956]
MRIGDIKVIDNVNYLILDILEKNNNIYVMVTKLNENNEPTMDEYKVYKIIENKWQLEENKQTLNELLPIFTKNINNMLNKLMGE